MFYYWGENILCLSFFYLFYYFILRKDTFFRRNRFFLLLSLLGSLLIPLIEFEQPAINYSEVLLPAFTVSIQEIPGNVQHIENQLDNSIPYQDIWFFISSIVRIVLTIKFLQSIYVILTMIKKNRSENNPGYRLMMIDKEIPICSFFNYIFLPKKMELTESEKEKILAHELAHIQELHTLDLIFIELLKIYMWFNPLIYLYEKEIKDQHEFIADATVSGKVSLKEYKRLIINQFFKQNQISLMNYFHQSQIKIRLSMLHKNQTPARMAWKAIFALPLLSMLVFIFACQKQEENKEKTKTEEKLIAQEDKKADNPKVIKKIDDNYNPGNIQGDIFTHVEQQPAFVGDMPAFYEYLQKELKYPAEARREGVEGKVFIEFLVTKDGDIANIQVLKGIGGGCDEEAIRVIKESGKWIPGKNEGKPVNTKMVIPIVFKLG